MKTPAWFGGAIVAALLLSACGKQEDAAADDAPSAETPAETATALATPGPRGTAAPDFGGTTRVTREADGIGSTPELALLSALQSAVAQVNGVRVASNMQQLRAGMSVQADGRHAGSVGLDAFQSQAVAASQGAVLGYEILSQTSEDVVDEETSVRVRASDEGYAYSASASVRGDASAKASAGDASAQASTAYRANGKVDVERGASAYEFDGNQRRMQRYWRVRLKVDVAQYRASDEEGRPKIIVASPRVSAKSYPVGDANVSSDEVARAIRARLSDTLTQTDRFIVLDREFGDELQAEIDHINSGNVRLEDTARIGQQLATDLILIPTIERFAYPRHVRQLRMSDRQVTSYSGGGRITLRLVNAATGQVVMSDSFDHELASTGPSTLPRNINGRGMAEEMMNALSSRIGTAVVTGIFPVSVVSLTGKAVVLSQGGDVLSVGDRWQGVHLGQELRDPQTGRSLGRNEMPCCTIRVERVAAKTSYGVIEEDGPFDASSFEPGSIELRERASAAPAAVATAAAAPARPANATPRRAATAAAAPAPAEDPDW